MSAEERDAKRRSTARNLRSSGAGSARDSSSVSIMKVWLIALASAVLPDSTNGIIGGDPTRPEPGGAMVSGEAGAAGIAVEDRETGARKPALR
jgi:hypothetical protein